MGLFTHLRKKKNDDDTADSIGASTDIERLIAVASKSSDGGMRSAALKRLVELTDISDADAVRGLISSADSQSFAKDIVKELGDNVLLELFRDNRWYSDYALVRIKDKNVLRGIFLDPKTERRYRISVLEAMADIDLIFRTACDEPDDGVRRAAVGMIEDPDMMDAVVDSAFRRAQRLSGEGVVPKSEYCGYEFERRNELLCGSFDSSKLKYINPITGEALCYSEFHVYGEYGLSRSFNCGIYRTVRDGIKDFHLVYPHAVVVRTDEPATDDEITVCPKCGHLREGAARAMSDCTCGSKLSGARVKYEYDGDE